MITRHILFKVNIKNVSAPSGLETGYFEEVFKYKIHLLNNY